MDCKFVCQEGFHQCKPLVGGRDAQWNPRSAGSIKTENSCQSLQKLVNYNSRSKHFFSYGGGGRIKGEGVKEKVEQDFSDGGVEDGVENCCKLWLERQLTKDSY